MKYYKICGEMDSKQKEKEDHYEIHALIEPFTRLLLGRQKKIAIKNWMTNEFDVKSGIYTTGRSDTPQFRMASDLIFTIGDAKFPDFTIENMHNISVFTVEKTGVLVENVSVSFSQLRT